jgi:hypothetical protein
MISKRQYRSLLAVRAWLCVLFLSSNPNPTFVILILSSTADTWTYTPRSYVLEKIHTGFFENITMPRVSC